MKKMFKNGFGVSVIENGYGSEEGLFELAVITKDGLHYENDVAEGDVQGWLTTEEVERLSGIVENFAEYNPNEKGWYKKDGTIENGETDV